jgi:hypothetical protein
MTEELLTSSLVLDLGIDNVIALLWDTHRRSLWIISGDYLYVATFNIKMPDALKEMATVPELYAFPPGVLPLCVAYVGMWNGLPKRMACDIRKVLTCEALSWTPYSIRPYMTTSPVDRTIIITFGSANILQYNPDTDVCRFHTPCNVNTSWRAASILPDGAFLLYDNRNWIMLKWNHHEDKFSEDIVYDGRILSIPLVQDCKHNTYFLAPRAAPGEFELHHIDSNANHKVAGINNRITCREVGVFPVLIGCTTSKGFYLMEHDQLTPYVLENGALVIADVPIQWTGETAWVDHESKSYGGYHAHPVGGACDGNDYVFYPSFDGRSIHCIKLPKLGETGENHLFWKRRRVDAE